MARKRATLTDLLNNLTFKVLYDKVRLLSMNQYTWGNLPDGMQERHIERHLFDRGMAGFYRKPKHGFMCAECQNGVGVNPYGDPVSYNMHGFGFVDPIPAEDCVIIENNMLRLATQDFVLFYVNKLAEAERTMDVNVKACKTPVIFACDDKDLLSFKRMFQQVDGNVPALFVDRGLNLDSIQAFLTGVQFMGNDLMDYKRSVEADLLTFLGINNPAVDKKERLITDEANSNNQLIASFGELQLEARKRACEAINDKWGLNITVERRQPEGVEEPVESGENDDV